MIFVIKVSPQMGVCKVFFDEGGGVIVEEFLTTEGSFLEGIYCHPCFDIFF